MEKFIACDRCKIKKAKCDADTQCANCKKWNVACNRTQTAGKKRKPPQQAWQPNKHSKADDREGRDEHDGPVTSPSPSEENEQELGRCSSPTQPRFTNVNDLTARSDAIVQDGESRARDNKEQPEEGSGAQPIDADEQGPNGQPGKCDEQREEADKQRGHEQPTKPDKGHKEQSEAPDDPWEIVQTNLVQIRRKEKKLGKENKKLENEIATLKSRCEELEQKIKELKQTTEANQSKDLQQENARLKAEVADLQKKLKNRNDAFNKYAKEVEASTFHERTGNEPETPHKVS